MNRAAIDSATGGDERAVGRDIVQVLEEASLAGLPALQSERYDGWQIRRSRGYTRRANSVWPLYPSRLELEEKVAYCEATYARAGLPCIFKLTRSSQPPELDGALAARGYRRAAETVVKVLELPDRLQESEESEMVQRSSRPDRGWLAAWQALSDRGLQAAVLKALLQAVSGEAAYMTMRRDEEAVACGRAVVAGSWVGLFDLLVAPDHRRRGFGTELTRARLAWGARHGARRAFLQVMEQNTAVRRIQVSLGFVEAYRYWYRVKD